jgi:endonuclease/exonuclease/phosphatase family metal-dependent hydrolase
VLCMQEVWLSDVVEFFDGLPQRHKVRCRNEASWMPPTVAGSGLGIATKFPIVQSSERLFLGPKVHAERVARKGMLHARLQVSSSAQVDLVTTHLQSGYGGAALQVRGAQLEELAAFVAEVGSLERDIFVCGDLNICGLAQVRSLEYQSLRTHFGAFQDMFAASDEPTFDPQHNSLAQRAEPNAPVQRLDYMLFRAARVPQMRIFGASTCLQAKLPASAAGPAVEPSDHVGLCLEVTSL